MVFCFVFVCFFQFRFSLVGAVHLVPCVAMPFVAYCFKHLFFGVGFLSCSRVSLELNALLVPDVVGRYLSNLRVRFVRFVRLTCRVSTFDQPV